MREKTQSTIPAATVDPGTVRGLELVAGSADGAQRPRRVLVSRVGRVGDIVLVTPALRGMLDRYEGAEVHLLTSPDGVRVLRGFDPRLREMVVYRRKGFPQKLRRLRVRRELQRRDYDLVFCLERAATYHEFFEGIGRTRYVAKRDAKIHHIIADLEAWQAPGSPRWVALPVQEDARARAGELLDRAGIPRDAILVGIHPTFSAVRKAAWRRRSYEKRKRWPEESWGTLARSIDAWGRDLARPLAVVTDLLPDERETGERIERASGGVVRVLAEPPDFERYKAVLERMDVLVTPDTGPMHVAAAVGTRLVALFPPEGSTQYEPYVDADRYTLIRPHSAAELSAVAPERVFEAVKDQLARGGLP